MPPLILHNVPDDELYVGEDGITRPYAMLFPGADGNPSSSRLRRAVPETGSFGKSTRRSRSRTGTPAAKREDPTLAAAEIIFPQFLAQRAQENVEAPQLKPSLSSSISKQNVSGGPLSQIDGNAGPQPRFAKNQHKEPTEVILYGFNASHQYAAIREYERIAGRICEDYPRDPPVEQRKYKADLRDRASLRTKPMTVDEKVKAMKFAGGNHWIKVTFESTENAGAAIESSPQKIMGHLVYAELYRGIPPNIDEEILANGRSNTVGFDVFGKPELSSQVHKTARASAFSRPSTTPSMRKVGDGSNSLSPPESQQSTATFDTATVASTASTATVTGSVPAPKSAREFCQRIPTARRMTLLPAESALLPQTSWWQKFTINIPFIGWMGKDVFSTLPKTEQGEFDWAAASLYWRLIWWIEKLTGLSIMDTKDD